MDKQLIQTVFRRLVVVNDSEIYSVFGFLARGKPEEGNDRNFFIIAGGRYA